MGRAFKHLSKLQRLSLAHLSRGPGLVQEQLWACADGDREVTLAPGGKEQVSRVSTGSRWARGNTARPSYLTSRSLPLAELVEPIRKRELAYSIHLSLRFYEENRANCHDGSILGTGPV